MATTTWNPSDKGASVALSGGNLIAGVSGTASGGVRTVDHVASTKFYFEVTFTVSSNMAMGIATSSATITTGGTWTNAAVVSNTAGAIFVNNSNSGVGTGGAITAGQTMCVAVDLNAARIWFRNSAAGNWNNNVTYDPATGVGGVSISTVFGAGVQAYGMGWFNSSTNGSYNANFGGSAFIGTVPSGFNSGFIPPVGGGTQPLAMVLA